MNVTEVKPGDIIKPYRHWPWIHIRTVIQEEGHVITLVGQSPTQTEEVRIRMFTDARVAKFEGSVTY